MKLYRTTTHDTQIDAFEVVRETAKTVVYLLPIPYSIRPPEEAKSLKFGNREQWHYTWEAARAFLLAREEGRVAQARRSLELANSRLGNVKGMKKPSTTQEGA